MYYVKGFAPCTLLYTFPSVVGAKISKHLGLPSSSPVLPTNTTLNLELNVCIVFSKGPLYITPYMYVPSSKGDCLENRI